MKNKINIKAVEFIQRHVSITLKFEELNENGPHGLKEERFNVFFTLPAYYVQNPNAKNSIKMYGAFWWEVGKKVGRSEGEVQGKSEVMNTLWDFLDGDTRVKTLIDDNN